MTIRWQLCAALAMVRPPLLKVASHLGLPLSDGRQPNDQGDMDMFVVRSNLEVIEPDLEK